MWRMSVVVGKVDAPLGRREEQGSVLSKGKIRWLVGSLRRLPKIAIKFHSFFVGT